MGTALNDPGNALWTLGDRESGTARLDKVVAAYRAALEERTCHRVPLDWAYSNHGLAHANEALFDRTGEADFLREAIAGTTKAQEVYQRGGIDHWLPVASESLERMRSNLPPDAAAAL